MRVVVKVGTSSITNEVGEINIESIRKICGELIAARAEGHEVVLVTSGAIAAGLPALGLGGDARPKDAQTLQAVSAVGQGRLIATYNQVLAELSDLVGGQVLIAPHDFMIREQYLHARGTLDRLLELGVIPIVNENDAIADDEIRFGDNDRIAALVAQLIGAEVLVLLTDADGLLTADPRIDATASLIEDVLEIDQELLGLAGGSGTVRGSGGMVTKLQAAKIAAWTGVRTVIAASERTNVVRDSIDSVPGVGTIVWPQQRRLPARKVWIAFAVGISGSIEVDAGAEAALRLDSSLLAPGVYGHSGEFLAGDAVELVGPAGVVFAKGLVRCGAGELTAGQASVVIHRDDLVVLS